MDSAECQAKRDGSTVIGTVTLISGRPLWKVSRRWTLAAVAAALARPLTVSASVRTQVARQVLAFYYGWYGNPQTTGMWRHWKLDQNKQPINITDIPQQGYYDSLDPAAVSEQVALAKKAGITGLIATWWGKHSFEDASLAPLLEAAQNLGLRVSAYLERVEGETEARRIDAGVEDLLYILRTHAFHPAWLRVDGKPVVFVYSRAGGALSVQAWRTVLERVRNAAPSGLVAIGPTNDQAWLEVFDGVHDYNVAGQTYTRSDSEIRNWAHVHATNLVSNAGARISCVTVIPGYDEGNTDRPPPRPTTPRANGRLYSELWEAAIAASPDWVLVTSWNEWHEGSEIAPSKQYGDQYINATATYAQKFLSMPARPR